ncbi:MAG: histidine kinase [Thiobacillus sp.]|nr:histidine kinase [Thiobacillus sp.]
MFKLLRYYSVSSLIAVLATAVLLTWFYRQVAIQGIVQLAERSNLSLARTAMNPIKPALLEFLEAAANFHAGSATAPPLPPELAGSIRALMQDGSVVRIKLYNRQGVVAFSSKPAQIGKNQSHNPGFITAINGGVGNALVYRDTFNSFDGATEEDNLMQTYIPVRASPTEPIQGVFEIYADVDSLVHQTERTEFIIMAGATLILLALYAVLVLIVRRANNTIEQQQRTIRERTETLELLSSHMLKSEESNKKRISFDLHEGLAQTLSALKLKLEGRHDRSRGNATDGSVDSIIPVLQQAIQEVRTIATDLRPPSLDDLGLLLTLNWVFREFEQQHPGISIERKIPLQEQDIPTPLKVILYRIIVSVLDDLAQHTNSRRIHLDLWLEDNAVNLLIDDTTLAMLDRTVTTLANIDPQLRAGFARMEALTTLSGGTFSASHFSGGGTTLRAVWSR